MAFDVTSEEVDEIKPVIAHFMPLRETRWRMAENLIYVSQFKPVAIAAGFARQDMPGREMRFARSGKRLITLRVMYP